VVWLLSRPSWMSLFFALSLYLPSYSQEAFLGISLGGANYQGDLQDKILTLDGMTPGIGFNILYAPNNRFSLSAELFRGVLSGSDAKPGSRNQSRNLQFVTQLIDASIAGRLNFYNNRDFIFIPYATAGATLFYVDPYTYDTDRHRVYLYPMSTEGQGLPGYSHVPSHHTLNGAILFGGGVEMRITKKIRMDIEVGWRKTFTDYIDDVSGDYPVFRDLLSARGPDAVQYSYRGDEVSGGSLLYPSGTARGNAARDDWYHMVSIRLRYSFRSWDLDNVNRKYLMRNTGWPYNLKRVKKGNGLKPCD